jgi:hypothetical protein
LAIRPQTIYSSKPKFVLYVFPRQSEPAGFSGMETRIEKSGRTLGRFAPGQSRRADRALRAEPTPPDFFYLNRL